MAFNYVVNAAGDRASVVAPKNLGWKHNTAATLNTNIFTPDLTPSAPPSKIYIATIYTGTSPHLLIKRINGGNTVTHDITITSATPYETSVWANPGDTFNIQFSVSGTINYLAVNEVIPQS